MLEVTKFSGTSSFCSSLRFPGFAPGLHTVIGVSSPLRIFQSCRSFIGKLLGGYKLWHFFPAAAVRILINSELTEKCPIRNFKFSNYPGNFHTTDSRLSRGTSMKFQFSRGISLVSQLLFHVKRKCEFSSAGNFSNFQVLIRFEGKQTARTPG